MRAKNVVAAALALVALGRGSGVARGEDAASLVRDGVELRRQGKDREALALFERAAALERSPRIVAQVALAEQSLGLWVKAERHLKEALEGKEGKNDPWIRKSQKPLADCWNVIEAHVASLEVWGSPAGAEVVIEGEVVGTLPFDHPARVAVGDVSVRVRAKGHVEAMQVVSVGKEGFARAHVELATLPSLPPASPTADVAAPGGATVLVVKDDGAPREATAPVYKRWWFWTAAGAVLVAAGTTALLLSHHSTSTTCMPEPGVPCVTW
ncbi:MAG: hypothetical protein JWM82_3719 [Myxococcales bacterium]|jgi:tetratricopeptide (TPR) repeat protein|nr:hypothetical protein [Myxococcales bacterium]